MEPVGLLGGHTFPERLAAEATIFINRGGVVSEERVPWGR